MRLLCEFYNHINVIDTKYRKVTSTNASGLELHALNTDNTKMTILLDTRISE